MNVSVLLLLVACGPSVMAQQVVTLSSDFQRGNNEGLISAGIVVERTKLAQSSFGPWTPTEAVTSFRQFHAAVAHDGYVYVSGGSTGFGGVGALKDILKARIGSDGGLGTWTPANACLTARFSHDAIVYNGFLYLVSGYGTGVLNDVEMAPFIVNGDLGAWRSVASLGVGRESHSSVAYNGCLYVTAGVGGGAQVDDVQMTIFRPDGTLESWTATKSLPKAIAGHVCVAYDGRLYVTGGNSNGILTDEVWVGLLQPDGKVTAWNAGPTMPVARDRHGAAAYNGSVYVIGGSTNVAEGVLTARVSDSGMLGAWAKSALLTIPRVDHAVAVHGDYAYLIGGVALTTVTDVQKAQFIADDPATTQKVSPLRGYYSHLVDLNVDAPVRSIRVNGQLGSNGKIRLNYRMASTPSTLLEEEKVVDSISPGIAMAVAGSARYVWLRLILDDTATTAASPATKITGITIGEPMTASPQPPGSPPPGVEPPLGTAPILPGAISEEAASGGCGSMGFDLLLGACVLMIWQWRR